MDALAPEVAVVGGGPAGLTTAIALAGSGIATVLVARQRADDHRTTALLGGSVAALATLGVWEACRPHAAPLRTIRLVDDTGRLIRAPEVRFEADEIGLDCFGENIQNRHLVAALEDHARTLPALTMIADIADSVALDERGANIRLAGGGTVAARLVIGADGRQSICRAAAGIKTDARRYPQTALTFNLGHARAHSGISTEFHTASGPFTLVPLPGKRSSLVFVTDPDTAETWSRADDAELALELERRSHSLLGRFSIEPGRGKFPLAVETARAFSGRRVALIGEAAHLIPPIGAQGLNLGLRDAATIAELVVEARRDGADIGADDVLARYDSARRADIASRSAAIDLLNRSLLTDFLPVQSARAAGLFLLDRIGPLRRTMMREGVTPGLAQPRLMRGEAL